jgi:hypothetical protein
MLLVRFIDDRIAPCSEHGPTLTTSTPSSLSRIATIALLEAALAHFITRKDVSQWLLSKGPIPRPVRRYQFRRAEIDILIEAMWPTKTENVSQWPSSTI